jgi:hypothetical protein
MHCLADPLTLVAPPRRLFECSSSQCLTQNVCLAPLTPRTDHPQAPRGSSRRGLGPTQIVPNLRGFFWAVRSLNFLALSLRCSWEGSWHRGLLSQVLPPTHHNFRLQVMFVSLVAPSTWARYHSRSPLIPLTWRFMTLVGMPGRPRPGQRTERQFFRLELETFQKFYGFEQN